MRHFVARRSGILSKGRLSKGRLSAGILSAGNLLLASLAGTILIVTGCGSGMEASVSGVVTLDGIPLDHGRIMFVPTDTGAGAFATINEDGSFEGRTGSLVGIQVGEYRVAVQSRGPTIPDPKGRPPMPGKLITPKKYASSGSSGVQVSIRPGSNQIDLELDSNRK